MGAEERERDKQQAAATSNVVRLPRDWIGPREELVPFGPRADELAGDRGSEDHASQGAGLLPEDFWGERSDALHDALQGPPPPAAETEPEPSWRPSTGTLRVPRTGRRRMAATAALVVAVAIGAAVFGQAGDGTDGGRAVGAGSGPLLGSLGPALARERVVVHLRPEQRRRRTAPKSRHGGSRARDAGSGAGAVATVPVATVHAYTPPSASVSYEPQATSHSVSSGASAQGGGGTGSGSGSGSGGGGSGSGSAGSGGGSAGPSGQGALVGPASCNC